jgi:dipeptide/tripeptide permease
MVFVLSFLPSILVGARLGHWVDRHISKWLIARNELISIASTVLCGLCIHYQLPMPVLCAVLAIRSMLMFVGRAAATKWLKQITPPHEQTSRIKLFYLGFFLSTAISGILASIVLKHASIWSIVVVDSASYLVGILLYLLLRSIPSPTVQETPPVSNPPVALLDTLSTIFAMPAVRTSFLIVCLSQAIFQGAYSALVSYLPISVFQLGVGGVGAFQLAASIGITAGFLVNWLGSSLLTERRPTFPIRSLALASAAIVFLLICVASPLVPLSLLGFLGLNFAYECVWLHHSSEFFRATPKNDAARYQFTSSSCAAFLMSLATLAYSAAVQYLGPVSGTVTVLIAGALIAAGLALISPRGFVVSALGEDRP